MHIRKARSSHSDVPSPVQRATPTAQVSKKLIFLDVAAQPTEARICVVLKATAELLTVEDMLTLKGEMRLGDVVEIDGFLEGDLPVIDGSCVQCIKGRVIAKWRQTNPGNLPMMHGALTGFDDRGMQASASYLKHPRGGRTLHHPVEACARQLAHPAIQQSALKP